MFIKSDDDWKNNQSKRCSELGVKDEVVLREWKLSSSIIIAVLRG